MAKMKESDFTELLHGILNFMWECKCFHNKSKEEYNQVENDLLLILKNYIEVK